MKKFITLLSALMLVSGMLMSQDNKPDFLKKPFENNPDTKIIFGAQTVGTMQFLSHENSNEAGSAGEITPIASGFQNAAGNVFINGTITDGISAYFEVYLSSEHHTEVWMREGYIKIDKLIVLNSPLIDKIMEVVSLKAGQMEINYGDWHLRRSDNGSVQNNPLIGNYIIDGNTTEIAVEVTAALKQFELMGGISGGTTKGDLNEDHGLATYGKIAYNQDLGEKSFLRLAGSLYHVDHSGNSAAYGQGTKNYLFSGNRSGARYKGILNAETDAGQMLVTNGQKITSYQLNSTLVFDRLEVFGTYEWINEGDMDGADSDETLEETWTQIAVDAKYNLTDKLYISGRYNVANEQEYQSIDSDRQVVRIQGGLGFMLTKGLLLKGEYVHQEYKNFGVEDARYGAEFNGPLLEMSFNF
ncbi:hypothetical protein AAG747_07180 [Rapidithrix thailandica]|uniref:Porin n=1 Tax=Rapidithrix thailandica TaxID=413964 RepID=A0AAW9S8N2_9BACT